MPPLVRRTVLAARAAALVGVVAFVVHTLVPDGGEVASFFDDWLYYAIELLAVAICASRVVLVRHDRAGWLALTLGLAFWAAGDLYYGQSIGSKANPPYPSLADAGYLAFYPFSYVGFIVLFRARVRRLTAGVWLDGLTAGFAIAALGAGVVLEVVLSTTSGSFAAVATNLAYPLADMVLLALVVGGFSLAGWRPGRAWLLLGAGLVVNGVGDGVFLYEVATGSYREGTLLDATWPTAMVLLASAAWVEQSSERAVDAEGRPLLLIPASCVAAAVSVLVLDHFERINVLALALAAVTLVCVVARLAVTFRENRRLLDLTRTEAVTDPLTGLANRRRLVTDLDRVLAEATPADPWLLAIFDLDGFKGYNDTFGHPAGDVLLVRLGERLATVPGPSGAAYRLGGDEFCLLAPAPGDAPGRLVDASVEALSEQGEGFSVETSFGAVFLPGDAHDPRDALREADARLYGQKHQKQASRERPHEVLLQALFEREPELVGHTRSVTVLAVESARRLGLTGRELEEVERAAQLHDIGKLAVPDEILHKPGPLTDGEWRFVRQHTVVGQRILAASPALRRIGVVVRATHERWDGSGYPDHLAGDGIPLAARVIAVCDAFDAMTSGRSYMPALTDDEAVAELERCAGAQFDPAVVAVVASAVHQRVAA